MVFTVFILSVVADITRSGSIRKGFHKGSHAFVVKAAPPPINKIKTTITIALKPVLLGFLKVASVYSGVSELDIDYLLKFSGKSSDILLGSGKNGILGKVPGI